MADFNIEEWEVVKSRVLTLLAEEGFSVSAELQSTLSDFKEREKAFEEEKLAFDKHLADEVTELVKSYFSCKELKYEAKDGTEYKAFVRFSNYDMKEFYIEAECPPQVCIDGIARPVILYIPYRDVVENPISLFMQMNRHGFYLK